MDILKKIKEQKMKRLQDARLSLPLSELKQMVKDKEDTRDFKGCITRQKNMGIKLIAEIKHASPSKGIITQDFNHIEIARLYDECSVDAISVLTEEDFFRGNLKYIKDVKDVVSRPLLRKDFIFEEYQVYESRVFDADAILLIASLLEEKQSVDLMSLAFDLGLSVLYEVHDEWELEKALKIESPIIGINNRNLKTMEIDINTSLRLLKMIPKEIIKVSESGFDNRADVVMVEDAGFDAILVGTSIMKAVDKKSKIKQLLGIN
ncbi:MAG: indole-3-glycerol phosphate synthase TrpC [Thermodesulfovibrionales bacterium]|nr:indole-3-glycerol phosphate synthase TrpC [Thermodesulfovibrionales bacterium]